MPEYRRKYNYICWIEYRAFNKCWKRVWYFPALSLPLTTYLWVNKINTLYFLKYMLPAQDLAWITDTKFESLTVVQIKRIRKYHSQVNATCSITCRLFVLSKQLHTTLIKEKLFTDSLHGKTNVLIFYFRLSSFCFRFYTRKSGSWGTEKPQWEVIYIAPSALSRTLLAAK